jgi:translation initiation factor IF-3
LRIKEDAVDIRYRINYQIKVPQVRLIDEDGSQLGVKPTSEALKLAVDKGMDLVEIAPAATPPVCKIISYSKLRYEHNKKEKEAKKKQKGGHLKEIRIRPAIGVHDLEVKLNHIREFLAEHDKVRVAIMFKGRENTHRDLGHALAAKLKLSLADVGELEGNPTFFGTRLFLNFVPRKEPVKTVAPKPKEEPAQVKPPVQETPKA